MSPTASAIPSKEAHFTDAPPTSEVGLVLARNHVARVMGTMEELNYTVIVEPCEEGGYWAYVPALPGCQTQGEALAEVVKMAHDAIQGYLACLAKDGEQIPMEPKRSDAAAFDIKVSAPQRA